MSETLERKNTMDPSSTDPGAWPLVLAGGHR